VARAIVKVPAQAKKGEIIEIRTLASHTMETGFRHSDIGKLIPRDIITRFVCTYNGVEIFSADLYPAIAANPYFSFPTVATESGTFEFKWTGDNGFSVTESASITVV
jgi:sulfur-oxidizing protein SoxZ